MSRRMLMMYRSTPQGWEGKMTDPVFLARLLAASLVAVALALSAINAGDGDGPNPAGQPAAHTLIIGR